jgi:hypothetical protein
LRGHEFLRENPQGLTREGDASACLFVCVSQGTAWSVELKVFASRAIWTVLGEIGPEFEKNSGHKLNAITGLSSEFVGRIKARFVSAPCTGQKGMSLERFSCLALSTA